MKINIDGTDYQLVNVKFNDTNVLMTFKVNNDTKLLKLSNDMFEETLEYYRNNIVNLFLMLKNNGIIE